MKRSLLGLVLSITAVLGIQLAVLPAANADGTGGTVTCGPNSGKAAYTIAYGQARGLSTGSKAPGPLGADDISAKIMPNILVGDPEAPNALGLPAVGIWTFVGKESNINFTANQVKSGGTYNPQVFDKQCTGQPAPVGQHLVFRQVDGHVSCPADRRPVVYSDGWGSHWVSYQSTDGGPEKWVQTMWSNYGTLKMGSLYIKDREVFDVALHAFGDPSRVDGSFAPNVYIGCSRVDDPNPQ